MAHVFRYGIVNAPAEKVWKIVGNFDGLPEWNPPIVSSQPEKKDGVQRRRLKFSQGGEFYEQHMGTDGTSTSYRILETNAPISGYLGSITVVDLGERCLLSWSSVFESDEPEIGDAVGSIYQAGIDTVVARFA